jgi:magnesium transporter
MHAETSSPEALDLRPGTVESGLVREVVVVGPDATVGDVRRLLRDRPEAPAAAVAVCVSDVFVGLITAERLAAAPDDAPAGAVMDDAPPRALPGEPQERAAWRAVEGGAQAVAVTTEDGRFLGIVPPAHLFAGLVAAHRQDMARLSGFLHDVEEVRGVSREALARRFWHRLPWLLLGMGGAMAAAGVMGRYEELLGANLLLALFVPGIVYLADAVGTQTETLIVRGLSVGVSVKSVAARELTTGVLVGGALAIGFALLGSVIWPGEPMVVAAVSLAIFAACATATLVAMGLPALLGRLGMDPAFGSGPLATVVQDLTSILIYLWIATRLVGA